MKPVREAQNSQPTLRDQFAMAALQGLLACPNTERTGGKPAWAQSAYEYADAMMAERAKKVGGQ